MAFIVADLSVELPTPVPEPGGGVSAPGCAGQAQTELEKAAWAN